MFVVVDCNIVTHQSLIEVLFSRMKKKNAYCCADASDWAWMPPLGLSNLVEYEYSLQCVARPCATDCTY